MRNTKDMKGYHGIRVGQRVYSSALGRSKLGLYKLRERQMTETGDTRRHKD